MTDKEIIKALKCCSKNPLNCRECGYKGRCNRIDCYDYLKRDAFDLINRQQADNERLKKLLAEADVNYNKCAKRFYKEGIKDFTERLKSYYLRNNQYKNHMLTH